MPLYGTDRMGASHINPVVLNIYNMAVVDFETFVDEDDHTYYQHWLKLGDRLYKDGSVLKADGKTLKATHSTMSIVNDIVDYRDFLIDIIGNTDYVIIDYTKSTIALQCWKGICLWLLTSDGTMVTNHSNNRKYVETSYRYELQYNSYINKILGININE
jgi:hypothetical protein